MAMANSDRCLLHQSIKHKVQPQLLTMTKCKCPPAPTTIDTLTPNDSIEKHQQQIQQQQQQHLTSRLDHMSLQPTLLPAQQAQDQSSHPLTEQMHRRSTILEPSSSSSSMLIYDDQSDSDNSQCAQNKEPVQITEQHIKRKRSIDLLSKMGLRRYQAMTMTRNKTTDIQQEQHDSDNNDEAGSLEDPDHEYSSSRPTSTHSHRKSMESTRSFIFGASPLPPHGERYIKIKSKAKTHHKALSKLVLAQTLTPALPNLQPYQQSQQRFDGNKDTSSSKRNGFNNSPPTGAPNRPYRSIWAMKFSKDGKYLAAGGQDCVLRVWEILSGKTGSQSHQRESVNFSVGNSDTIKVFHDAPIQEYRGHKADILDISWSKNNFLLSSSMDKTVRLWHVSNSQCLCVFAHLDFVTGIKFHPKDDRFFLSGSLDSKLRLWSITDKKVAFWNEVPNENLITAVGFTLDGRTACVGSYTGQVYFYETQGLKYNTQINVKKRGAKRGKKITGLEAMPNMPPGEEKLLVTSNDSRIRMINMKDKSLIYKYKGLDNSTMQIKASFNDDGRYIICGSEDCNVYLWPTGQTSFSANRSTRNPISPTTTNCQYFCESMHNGSIDTSRQHYSNEDFQQPQLHQQKSITSWLKRSEQQTKDKAHHHHEFFEGHRSTITNAIFAPHQTRQDLACTGDDIIFNHTPVPSSMSDQPEISPHQHSHQARTFLDNGGQDNDDSDDDEDIYHDSDDRYFDDRQRRAMMVDREQYDYPDSQIIVTSDVHGCIQVWRTDSGVYDSPSPPPLKSHSSRKSMDSSILSVTTSMAMTISDATKMTNPSTYSPTPLASKPTTQNRVFTLFSGRSGK